MKQSFEAKQIIILFAFLTFPIVGFKLTVMLLDRGWMNSNLMVLLAFVAFAISAGGVVNFCKQVQKHENALRR